MRRFLRRNQVPMELASRIQRFVEHAHSQQQKKMSVKAGAQEQQEQQEQTNRVSMCVRLKEL